METNSATTIGRSSGGSRTHVKKLPRQVFFYLRIEIDVDGLLVVSHCILPEKDAMSIKSFFFKDAYVFRVVECSHVESRYKDFRPNNPVYADLISAGKTLTKKLDLLSQHDLAITQ